MGRETYTVPYGFEPAAPERKGTVIFYDAFETTTDEELNAALEYTRRAKFTKLVLYPLHEETVRRMSKTPVSRYYKREDRVHEWKRDQGAGFVTVEGFEGQRKKYTPLDLALRHIAERYPAPHFLYMTPETANQFASYSSFEEWIRKIRLVLSEQPAGIHTKLEAYRHRWETADSEGQTAGE